MKRKVAYVLIVSYMCNVLMIAGVYFYVGYAIRENNRRTCDLYRLIYQPNIHTPIPNPNDPRQRRAYEVRQEIKELLDQYECEY